MEQKGKRRYVLTKDFNTFKCNKLYTVERNMFVVIVYKLLVQKKYWNIIGTTALKLMANKRL